MFVCITQAIDMCVCLFKPWAHVFVSTKAFDMCFCIHKALYLGVYICYPHVSLYSPIDGYVCLYTLSLVYVCLYYKALDMCVYNLQALHMYVLIS